MMAHLKIGQGSRNVPGAGFDRVDAVRSAASEESASDEIPVFASRSIIATAIATAAVTTEILLTRSTTRWAT